MRVKGVDYRLTAAAVYATFLPWHGGLSGSIPLVINTPENFLIKAGVLSEIIPTTLTLGSVMNIGVNLALLITLPILFMLLRPAEKKYSTVRRSARRRCADPGLERGRGGQQPQPVGPMPERYPQLVDIH